MTTAAPVAGHSPAPSPSPPTPPSSFEGLRSWLPSLAMLCTLVASASVALASHTELKATVRDLAAREEAHERAPAHPATSWRLDQLEGQRAGEAAERRTMAARLEALDRRLLAVCLATKGAKCE